MLLQDFLLNAAHTYGEKTALVHGKRRITYSTLCHYAKNIAAWLGHNGLQPGQRVALLTDDPTHYISCYFGILTAGGAVVGLNTQTSERSLATTLNDCTPSFLLISGRSTKYSPYLIKSHSAITVQRIEDICEVTDTPPSLQPPSFDEKSLAQIIYTSGTTGRPKGVMLTHRNLVANTQSIIQYLELSQRDTVMAVLPFFYSYGNSIMLTHIGCGGTMVVNQSFVYPNVILEQMVVEKVTGLSGVPSTFAILLHRSAASEYSFPDLRYLTQAGAAMSPTLANQVMELFSHCDIYIMYGQTEAAPRLSYLAPEDLLKKPGSIGKAIPGVHLEVVNEDGSPAPVGETGEIVASGDNIMTGYWRRPKETAQALRDGKLWTGDLAYQDEDGYLYIVSRKSEMIKSGSHRIAPREIEEIIAELEGIQEVAVTGKQDEILGELIYAYVVLAPESLLSPKEIVKFCRRNLPPFKVPHHIVIADELPKSESGKIKKSELK